MIHIIPEKKSIILGFIESYPNPIAINFINMTTKSYIFYCSRKNLRLNIYNLQNRLNSAYDTEEFISIKNDRLQGFNRILDPFKLLFSEN